MKAIKDKTEVGGMWGEKLAVTKINGRLIVNNRPKRKVTADLTDKQIAVKKRFLEASQYANGQVAQPEKKAIYVSGITPKSPSAYAVAMKDYLIAPEVELIETGDYTGAIGDAIVIKATDDFMVTSVKVIITDSTGVKLEQGEAIQDPEKNFLWEYKTTVANPGLTGTTIKATAFDRPGNKTTLEKVLG